MIYYCIVTVVDIMRTNIEMTFFNDLYVNYTKKIEQSITNPQYDIWINGSILVILVDLILAIMEELYFRVFIHKTLIKRNYSKFSIIMISAKAFGLRHWFFTPFSVIAIVFVGVILSFVMFATDNIIYTIFLHGGLRMINVLIMRCFKIDYLKEMQNPYGNIMEIILLFAVLIVISIVSYIIRRRIFSEKMKEGVKELIR